MSDYNYFIDHFIKVIIESQTESYINSYIDYTLSTFIFWRTNFELSNDKTKPNWWRLQICKAVQRART